MKFDTVSMPLFIGIMASADDAWKARSLPLHQRGNTLTYRSFDTTSSLERHAAHVYFRETADVAWSVDAIFADSSKVQMIAPDGRVIATVTIDAEVDKRAHFTVPSDGQSGDYMLACVAAKPQRRPVSFGRIIRSDLPFVYDSTKANYTQPTGIVRAAYFQQPAQVSLQVLVEWRTPQRHLDVINAQGEVLASTATTLANGDGTVLLLVPASPQARELVWRVGAVTTTAAEESYPFRIYGSDAIQVLAVNPGVWFAPKVLPVQSAR
jgi:hypothetical protein